MKPVKRERIAGMGMHYKFRPLDYFLESQQELGVQSIEFWCARPHFLLDDYGFEDVKKLREKLDFYGMKLAAFSPECTVYNYNLCAQDETAARQSMGYFEKAIEAAEQAEAKLMVVNCCGGLRDEEKERIFERAVDRLTCLGKTASEHGILLAVETLCPGDSPVFNTLTELKSLLDAVNSKNVQACLDLTAAGMAGETMKDWFELLGDKVRHIRFTDGKPGGRLAWGDGLRPLEDQFGWIEQYGYTGYLSLSVNDPRYLDNPREADEKNWKALKAFVE